ncbi:MAG: hypothetical protein AVDCRST_MAG37-3245 [uncultured Rubrobacteraceae bacterium]|uniref:NIF system FeS cluster assembly NifU C-terminal domain-containing protein n=1 Tax=uncultured Rubrobacteraceae bacterium TaxID=349277 RepID=A0A6J4R2X5_9ACTN|nr:MAG: hypothetical protein AVDCRST_MAG37-3245 [uncultured Rubrobacteraceae bacterium]
MRLLFYYCLGPILRVSMLPSARRYSDIIGLMNETMNMRSRIERALDKVRPALKADGGDARVVECDETSGRVSIEMLGACGGCPLSQLDFVYAIETLIRREVPEVRDIVAV